MINLSYRKFNPRARGAHRFFIGPGYPQSYKQMFSTLAATRPFLLRELQQIWCESNAPPPG
jgi:hypothetical protein